MNDSSESVPTDSAVDDETVALIVERNIRAMIEHRRAETRNQSIQNRVAQAISRFIGSHLFVYIHIVAFGSWILLNLGFLGIPPVDSSFVTLAVAASVETIFLSTFVLINQNRMAALADKRADLDLQISLLAEHEITRLIHLVSAIAERMNIEQAHDADISELKRDVAPVQVLDRIAQSEREFVDEDRRDASTEDASAPEQ